jgi:hypothetical protein
LNTPDLLVDFRVFGGRRLGIRSRARPQVRSNFGLSGIRIGRSSNIAADTKARFEGSLCGDVCVELGLVCDEVGRSHRLALLQSTPPPITFQICSPGFLCGGILPRPSASFLWRHIVLLLIGIRSLDLRKLSEGGGVEKPQLGKLSE